MRRQGVSSERRCSIYSSEDLLSPHINIPICIISVIAVDDLAIQGITSHDIDPVYLKIF